MLVIHLLSTSVLKGDGASGLIPDRTTCRKVVKIYILSDYKQKELKECCLQKNTCKSSCLKKIIPFPAYILLRNIISMLPIYVLM